MNKNSRFLVLPLTPWGIDKVVWTFAVTELDRGKVSVLAAEWKCLVLAWQNSSFLVLPVSHVGRGHLNKAGCTCESRRKGRHWHTKWKLWHKSDVFGVSFKELNSSLGPQLLFMLPVLVWGVDNVVCSCCEPKKKLSDRVLKHHTLPMYFLQC